MYSQINFAKASLYKLLYLILLGIIVLSCKKKQSVDFEYLIEKYSKNPADSLKLESVIFIKNNISGNFSEKLSFFDDENQIIDFRLDTITSDSMLNRALQKKTISYKSDFIKDASCLTTELLDDNICKAIESWNKYPWSKNVPKDIFMNYLLPYKVFGEYPENWRNYFLRKYKDSLTLYQNNNLKDANKVYSFCSNEIYKWAKYSNNFTKLTQYPSLTELLAVREGECYNLSQLLVYITRSVGIPSTIDLVPLWGKTSGGHATNVFYRVIDDKSTKAVLRPASGNGLTDPPKVFRVSFKKTNLWSDSIKPLMKNKKYYIPEFLKSDHHLDVTDEYVNTKTLNFLMEQNETPALSYICVFNYGTWKPLSYGRYNKQNHIATFYKTATDMLYHIAVPEKNTYRLVGKPFVFDTSGKTIYFSPKYQSKRDMLLNKVNRGDQAWVEKDKFYTLTFLDQHNKWKEVATKLCKKDSVIIFPNVPSEALYMLKEQNSTRNLERLFIYKKNQIWY